MSFKSILLATAVAAAVALPTQAGAYTIISNDFSTNPFATTRTMSNFLGGSLDWYGAQHGVPGDSRTMAWRDSPGAGGANGFIGYSPATRYFVSLITRLPGGPLNFGALDTLSADTRNASWWPAGLVRAAIHTGGAGGTWYVSTTGVSGNSATADWVPVSFDLQALQYQSYTNNGNLPNPQLNGSGKGPTVSLASSLQVDWVGLFVDFSGQNDPNRSDVLRFDNFKLTAVPVPVPASLALLGMGLLGLAAVRRGA
jgi:hypothetical protein